MSFLPGSASLCSGSILQLSSAMREVCLHFRPNKHRTMRNFALRTMWQIEAYCPDLGVCPWNSHCDSHRLALSPVPTQGGVRWCGAYPEYRPTSFYWALNFVLADTMYFKNWRFTQAILSLPFFQQHLLTWCLCVTSW